MIDFKDDWPDVYNNDDYEVDGIDPNLDQVAGMDLRVRVQTNLLRWFFTNHG